MEDTEEQPNAIKIINDPRVSGFLRLFQSVITTLTAAAILGVFALLNGLSDNQQKILWSLERLEKRVDDTEELNKTQQIKLDDVIVNQKVQDQKVNSMGWRLNRLERGN